MEKKLRERYKSLLPVAYEVEAGKSYYWCACGQSKTPPLCDKNPHCSISVEYRAIITETVLFCGCKKSENAPLCDGSHAMLIRQLINKENKK